jgi:hypothetical protein
MHLSFFDMPLPAQRKQKHTHPDPRHILQEDFPIVMKSLDPSRLLR